MKYLLMRAAIIPVAMAFVTVFATPLKEKKVSENHKGTVVALLKSIESGDPAPLTNINPDKYIQHNLTVADGLAGFRALLRSRPPGSVKVNTVRVFQDGAYVFTHTSYDSKESRVGFDIFRFENGKIVEHWDNQQKNTKLPNPGGHTMLDGATVMVDPEKTEANKALVRSFLDQVIVNEQVDKLGSYFDNDKYLQHNPAIGDTASGLMTAFETMKRNGKAVKFDRVHKVLGEGNFVLAVSEGREGSQHTAFFDLFRVENGKIAEHWDTIQEIPNMSEWKNRNGKF